MPLSWKGLEAPESLLLSLTSQQLAPAAAAAAGVVRHNPDANLNDRLLCCIMIQNLISSKFVKGHGQQSISSVIVFHL